MEYMYTIEFILALLPNTWNDNVRAFIEHGMNQFSLAQYIELNFALQWRQYMEEVNVQQIVQIFQIRGIRRVFAKYAEWNCIFTKFENYIKLEYLGNYNQILIHFTGG
jgi:hypothetical protein